MSGKALTEKLKCPFCGDIVNGHTGDLMVPFDRGHFYMINVPAWQCACGSKLIAVDHVRSSLKAKTKKLPLGVAATPEATKGLRKRLGLTVAQTGRLLGASERCMHRWEGKGKAGPSFRTGSILVHLLLLEERGELTGILEALQNVPRK
jgi:YgiT-type zinc finger domain-containing protein